MDKMISSIIGLIIFFAIMSSVLEALFPILIFGGVIFVLFKVLSENGRTRTTSSSSYRSSSVRPGTYFAMATEDKAAINVYLRRQFKGKANTLDLGDGYSLRLVSSPYVSLDSVAIYQNDRYLCSFIQVDGRYQDVQRRLIAMVLEMAKGNVIDVEAKVSQAPSKPEVKEEVKKDAKYYRDLINQLNIDIPDEEISNGLYETASLLDMIGQLQNKLAKTNDKTKKLFEYYLPMLVNILQQFVRLQNVHTDPNYAKNRKDLSTSIELVNQAMKTIISSMSDQDFMNLSADISTLSAILQKDGLYRSQDLDIHAQETSDEQKGS